MMRRAPFVAILALALACGAAGGGQGPAAVDDRGAAVYATYCVLCHGKDGSLGVNGAKDLAHSTLTRDEMILVITNGRNMMQPFRGVLTAGDITAVVDHVRALAEPGTE